MRALKRLIFATLILTVWSFTAMTVVAQDEPADQPMETPMPQQAPPPPDGAQGQVGQGVKVRVVLMLDNKIKIATTTTLRAALLVCNS
jgi:hypothetical protein